MFQQFYEVRDRFYEDHGSYVVAKEGPVIFHDGAIDENSATGLGRLTPPPDDPWQLAKNIQLYWELKAAATVREFATFKAYLHGTGCPVPGVDSKEQKIAHLKTLRQKVETAKRKLRSARRAVDDAEPEWHRKHREATDADDRRRQEFLVEVNSIRI